MFSGRRPKDGMVVTFEDCSVAYPAYTLCEIQLEREQEQKFIVINGTNRWPPDTGYTMCPSGHFTHQFLSCDARSSCWYDDPSSYCKTSVPRPLELTFTCSSQVDRVPYTLVCDHRSDCLDGSDEHFCRFPDCRAGQFSCQNKQCIQPTKACDGWADCVDNTDEQRCSQEPFVITIPVPPPALVSVTRDGHFDILPLTLSVSPSAQQGQLCPDTHFQCLDDGNCLPLMLRCNSVYDCPGHEDETGCDTCPGFYRCRSSQVCLLYDQLCDNHAHCPQQDDELLCNTMCPSFCICRGMAFICRQNFTASTFPLLRFLDASSTGMTPGQLTHNILLIDLTLVNCSLTSLSGLSNPNLLSLSVQDNHLGALSHLHLVGVPQLRKLSVAGNPLHLLFEGDDGPFPTVISLDLSRTLLHKLNVTAFNVLPRLQVLNLSHSGVQRIAGDGFSSLEQLRVIDLRGCPLTRFPPGLFKELDNLQVIFASNFKICCPALLPPDFNLRNCFSPSDEVSSCDDLLRGNEYRVFLFIFSAIALVGNTVSFTFRTYVSKRQHTLGYGIFVTHLSVSDFLMGIYLAVIGIADQMYRSIYLWNDLAWKHSATCKFAGFLSLLSSEVSALIMCLITIDRFLVLRFPFSRLHFSPTSAHIASFTVWLLGVALVAVPLLPVASYWQVYSQTGICIPLPTKRTDFAGYGYTFGILIVFNCVVFVVISAGQMVIYSSVRASSISVSNTNQKSKDLSIARRLITVAMSDFLCWFPVCVVGLMSFNGVPIPGEVNLAVAVFVLPLNSAINPCLYTLNVILERRNRAREEKLRTFLLAQLKSVG